MECDVDGDGMWSGEWCQIIALLHGVRSRSIATIMVVESRDLELVVAMWRYIWRRNPGNRWRCHTAAPWVSEVRADPR